MTVWCATGAALASAAAATGPASAPASATVMAARRPVRRMLTARSPFAEGTRCSADGRCGVSEPQTHQGLEIHHLSAFVLLPPHQIPGLMRPDQRETSDLERNDARRSRTHGQDGRRTGA